MAPGRQTHNKGQSMHAIGLLRTRKVNAPETLRVQDMARWLAGGFRRNFEQLRSGSGNQHEGEKVGSLPNPLFSPFFVLFFIVFNSETAFIK